MATAELTSPDESVVVGVVLTVLGRLPVGPGGWSVEYAAEEHGGDVAALLISPRRHAPLAYELEHGSFDGYEPGPEAGVPDPAQRFDARLLGEPVELLVFGPDAAWAETTTLEPCAAEPCASYASGEDSTVLVVPPGTAARFGIGPGWTIAVAI